MTKQEIEKLMKGCGKEFETDTQEGFNDDWVCGDIFKKEDWRIGILNLCPTCQAKLQTWKQALTSEIKFLEDYLIKIRSLRRDYAGLQMWQYPIQERIAELNGALE